MTWTLIVFVFLQRSPSVNVAAVATAIDHVPGFFSERQCAVAAGRVRQVSDSVVPVCVAVGGKP